MQVRRDIFLKRLIARQRNGMVKTTRTYKPHELLDEGNFAQSLFGTCPFQFLVFNANLEQAKQDFNVRVAEPPRHSALSELAKAADPAIKAASFAVLANMIS